MALQRARPHLERWVALQRFAFSHWLHPCQVQLEQCDIGSYMQMHLTASLRIAIASSWCNIALFRLADALCSHWLHSYLVYHLSATDVVCFADAPCILPCTFPRSNFRQLVALWNCASMLAMPCHVEAEAELKIWFDVKWRECLVGQVPGLFESSFRVKGWVREKCKCRSMSKINALRPTSGADSSQCLAAPVHTSPKVPWCLVLTAILGARILAEFTRTDPR